MRPTPARRSCAVTPEPRSRCCASTSATLRQVADAATEAKERFGQVHLCVNNAGLIGRSRTETVDGFETTFGVNHLGHFAWTAHLLPALLAAPDSRVVTVSSLAHLQASMDWNDLMGETSFKPVAAYRRSKLANLLHSAELQRRLSRSDRPGASDTIAVASHPGIAASPFWENAAGPRFTWAARIFDAGIALMFSTAAQGAVPVVHAATAAAGRGGPLLRASDRPAVGPPRPGPTVARGRRSGGRGTALDPVRGAHRASERSSEMHWHGDLPVQRRRFRVLGVSSPPSDTLLS